MQIVQRGDWWLGARITGPDHHFLGLRLGPPADGPGDVPAAVRQAVADGVAAANAQGGTGYSVAAIEIDPRDRFVANAYSALAYVLGPG